MSIKSNPQQIDTELQKELLYRTKRIRMVEEAIADRYADGKMRCPTHLSIGQEANAVATGMALTQQDLVVSTHRSHAHYLAKGGNLKAMLAELYGKATGCSSGKGGSMHLLDRDTGFMGSTAIVAGTIPLGAGLGLALQKQNSPGIACIFVGDGSIEEGVFYETANFIALRKLPVLFICENNFYSVYSSLKVRQPEGRSIASLVEAIGIKSYHDEGIDIPSIYERVSQAAGEVRSGAGPRFVEIKTYRWREHCGPNYDNDIGYRDPAELKYWLDNDALTRLQSRMLNERSINKNDIDTMETNIRKEIDDAFIFAEKSPFPEPLETFTQIYANNDYEGIPWCED